MLTTGQYIYSTVLFAFPFSFSLGTPGNGLTLIFTPVPPDVCLFPTATLQLGATSSSASGLLLHVHVTAEVGSVVAAVHADGWFFVDGHEHDELNVSAKQHGYDGCRI